MFTRVFCSLMLAVMVGAAPIPPTLFARNAASGDNAIAPGSFVAISTSASEGAPGVSHDHEE